MIQLKVIAVFCEDGSIKPLKILSGQKSYPIQQIVYSRRFSPLEFCDKPAVEYKVVVCNQVKYIYREIETNRWFSIKAISA